MYQQILSGQDVIVIQQSYKDKQITRKHAELKMAACANVAEAQKVVTMTKLALLILTFKNYVYCYFVARSNFEMFAPIAPLFYAYKLVA